MDDLNLLKKLIAKKKMSAKLMMDEEEDATPSDEGSKLEMKAEKEKVQKSNEEDGLAPDIEEEGEGLMDKAEEVLGRKPMSLTKDGDKEEEPSESAEMAFDKSKAGGEVSDDLIDERLLEQLKGGRKPSRLWDRVQLHISK